MLRDLFNICLFMNNFNKKKEKKYNINKEYINNCYYYDKKMKKKLIKKKEKCLDILSTDEGDDDYDSDNKLTINNELFEQKVENEKKSIININNEQNSIVYSPIKVDKVGKTKRLNNAKSSKNLNYLNKKFLTDKKVNLNPQKINLQNISLINRKLSLIYKNTNIRRNTKEGNMLKINNTNNSVQNFNANVKKNKETDNNNNNYKKVYEINTNKNIKINNYNYFYKNIKNRLPHIISPRKRKDFGFQEFSLNNIENYNIVPIVLPNIENIKKVKNIRYQSIKKKIRKKSSTAKGNYYE